MILQETHRAEVANHLYLENYSKLLVDRKYIEETIQYDVGLLFPAEFD